LVLLAVGPLLVSSTLSFQRAQTEQTLLARAEDLRATALASSSIGRLGAYLEFERTMTMGTVQLIEAKIPLALVAPYIGGDPRDAVAMLVTTVDAAEPIVTERLRANHDPAIQMSAVRSAGMMRGLTQIPRPLNRPRAAQRQASCTGV
jgi:hypothetical protein